MSEATNISDAPMPSTIGLPLRATTSSFGWLVSITTSP